MNQMDRNLREIRHKVKTYYCRLDDRTGVNLLHAIDQCILFSSREYIPIPECIKEILLNRRINLSPSPIENLKLHLVKLAKLGKEYISLVEVDPKQKLSAEDKLYMLKVDEIYRTHLKINPVIWQEESLNYEADPPSTGGSIYKRHEPYGTL